MGVRVRDFSHAHPSADATFAPVLERLDTRISRMEELVRQQEGGYLSKHSSVIRRKDLRRRLRDGLLRHLVTVAEVAGEEVPGLAEKFRLPRSNTRHAVFQGVARKMLEEGQANKEVLAKYGLADKLFEDLGAAVDEFDTSVAETNEGLRSHVGARAELQALGEEVVLLVGMLDGLNRYRFEHDAQLLAAWKSARHVQSGPQIKEVAAAPAPAPTSGGEVKPAA
jgi:hypothetical protein